ncbi:MAG: RNA degradosome polyphosphate kinase, partial [Phycisphaeraceae bacterium]
AEAGKQVVVLVELKARFDEERNVELAQRLEKAGIHVVYGVIGLKTHTKTALVVRQEGEALRTYAHIGTGNYNAKTADLYTDLGLLTCDPRITADLVQLFHFLTGRSLAPDYKHLLIAPTNMRRRFVEMIQREIEHCDDWRARGGAADDPDRPYILAKMNSLEDEDICRKLYEASCAGVKIDLIVRGFCCLRPGVEGLSENIKVMSVIGRFLEHSRVYGFHNAGDTEYYIGSADWMYRNLNNRVECITPIYEPSHRAALRSMLDTMLADQRQAWDMHPDGTYTQRTPADVNSGASVGTHRTLMDQTRLELLNAGV